MMQKTIWLFLLITGMIFSASCKKTVYIAPVVPDTVSFSKHIIPMFNQYCNNPGCHSGYQPQGNLDLSSSAAYQQLMSKSAIDTLHPSSSLLYSQMNSINKPMPPSGKLDTFYLKEVLRWIEQGARNN
jgi:hypothetical protein